MRMQNASHKPEALQLCYWCHVGFGLYRLVSGEGRRDANGIKTVSILPTTPEKFKNATVIGHFGSVFRKNRSGKSHDYRYAIVFENLRFENAFQPHEDEQPAFSKSFGLKSVFGEKLRFRDGLVWTVTVEIKLCFQISLA